MSLIEFSAVSDELSESENMRVMSALFRTSRYHGADNVPAVLIVTDVALYWGGTDAVGRRFFRVPLRAVLGARIVGRLIWEALELRHMDIDGEKTLYICPFTGSLGKPRKDPKAMGELLDFLRR